MTNAEGRLAADEGNDVEPKGDVAQSAATDVSNGGQGEALLLVAVDRGSGVFPTVVTAGFDLHEDEFAPIVGNDVDFQGVTTPVALHDVVVAFDEILTGGVFAGPPQFVVKSHGQVHQWRRSESGFIFSV